MTTLYFNLDLFEFWANNPVGNFSVMELPTIIKLSINSHSKSVVISPYTYSKQLLHHPELKLEDYAVLPLFGSNLIFALQSNKLPNIAVLVSETEGTNLWLASVKAVQGGACETFLTSFRRSNQDDVSRERKKGRVLMGAQP